jgi:hypothetical protein
LSERFPASYVDAEALASYHFQKETVEEQDAALQSLLGCVGVPTANHTLQLRIGAHRGKTIS